MIVVEGNTLAGMAAAARLARLGHSVSLIGEERPAMTGFLELPAAWRDLFTKTGRPFAGTLGSMRAELAPAPPVTYVLPDGAQLLLPDERGGQFNAIQTAFGRRQAELWRDTLDLLDDVWAALRLHGLERATHPKQARKALLLGMTLADLADRAGRLAPIILAEAALAGTDSPRAPALLATRLVVVRTFSRHRLVRDGRTLPTEALLDLVAQRLVSLGVRRSDTAATHRLDCRPALPPRSLFGTRLRAALHPVVEHGEGGAPEEIIDLTAAPRRTVRAEYGSTTWDFTTRTERIADGLAPDSANAWLARTLPSATAASAASTGGAAPWAQLLSGALAAYQVHTRLTGEDPSPSNTSFTMPRRAR